MGPQAVTIPLCLVCYKPSDGKYSCPKVNIYHIKEHIMHQFWVKILTIHDKH